MAGAVDFDQILGRVARTGDVRKQGASTYGVAADAIREGRWDDAAELVRYAATEAEEGHTLYPLFADRARAFLRAEGIPAAALDAEEGRLEELLRLPDGSGFDLEAGWSEFVSLIEASAKACEGRREGEALDALERARRAWLATHDRGCDLVGGLIDACARLLGEDRVADLWDALMVDLYATRDRYDIDRTPWARSLHYLVLDTLESLRGHLSGPDRMGAVEVREESDRIVFRFDPCGSGGRTLRADAEGGPARPEPPYRFAVTTRPHDWSWGEEGVCLYCVHCCRLQEQVPIERFGYPVRVVDPPRWPAARDGGEAAVCTWTIYKDPATVPDEAYRRVGRSRPARLGSSARVAADEGVTGPASPRPPVAAPP